MATTVKKYMITEKVVTEAGKPTKYKGWDTVEVPTADAIADAAEGTEVTTINKILKALRDAGIVAPNS